MALLLGVQPLAVGAKLRERGTNRAADAPHSHNTEQINLENTPYTEQINRIQGRSTLKHALARLAHTRHAVWPPGRQAGLWSGGAVVHAAAGASHGEHAPNVRAEPAGRTGHGTIPAHAEHVRHIGPYPPIWDHFGHAEHMGPCGAYGAIPTIWGLPVPGRMRLCRRKPYSSRRAAKKSCNSSAHSVARTPPICQRL